MWPMTRVQCVHPHVWCKRQRLKEACEAADITGRYWGYQLSRAQNASCNPTNRAAVRLLSTDLGCYSQKVDKVFNRLK